MTNIKLVEGKGFIDLDKPENQAKLTPDQIAELVKNSNNVQSQVMAKLETLPNFKEQIEAMKESPKFKDLAEALSLVVLSTKPEETRPLSKQVQAIAKTESKLKTQMQETGAELLAFIGVNGNKETPPQPQPIDDPLTCKFCGGKLKPQWTKCANCGAPIKPKQLFSLPECFKPKHQIKFLDACAGIVTIIIWLAATGLLIQSFSLTLTSIIGIAVFWLGFIVVFRLMISGILD